MNLWFYESTSTNYLYVYIFVWKVENEIENPLTVQHKLEILGKYNWKHSNFISLKAYLSLAKYIKNVQYWEIFS